jgi:catechol 2,3-dioxygenase-like lactoylglutathione lyase family enzyme
VTDPQRSIAFYTSRFDCERLPFGGGDEAETAVFAQKSWLRFTKVPAAAPSEIRSAIWHIGWGAEDMPAEFRRQQGLGTPFDTPITELFPKFWYAYVAGPDGELIELNTARHHNFGHLHLISNDAIAAGEWYVKHLGAKWASGKPPASREPRFIGKWQVGPSASLLMDNVNIIIFPVEYARQQWPEIWKEGTQFASPRGRVIDHISFSVDKLPAAIERLRADGVKVLANNFVEGPDRIQIELVEGHTHGAWGASTAGQPVPDFTHGEECLFCHRNNAGRVWQRNAHNITTQQREDGVVTLGRSGSRQLARTGYNRLAFTDGKSKTDFNTKCAGCHTTAVDPKEHTYSYLGLDCYTCHGVADLAHSGDPSKVLLSRKRRDGAAVVTSVCGSCHLRGATSRWSGLPFPSNFVPGNNVFQDLRVNLSLLPDDADRHVYRSVRDVALAGSSETCLACHSIHGQSTEKHRRAAPGAICNDCHIEGRPRKEFRRTRTGSVVCEN